MGISLSCPLAGFEDMDFEGILVRSFSFQDRDIRNPLRSVSFNGRDSERALLKSFGSRQMIFKRTVSFRGRELETVLSFKTPSAEMENHVFGRSVSPKKKTDHVRNEFPNSKSKIPEPDDERSRAALKLQKVYKSFRTRRQLADCAVLVEQRWWKLLDFAELKRSSISFFDIEKPETAVSRWSRARTRAAKVGKGLSKDEKARKLALQHWLEAIDPRHRYGHNLQFYYVRWLHCDSKQPFFYWLDIGEGKEVNLERCPRYKLHQQCIKYLGPIERQAHEVVVENGKFLYKYSRKLIHTTEGPKDDKWIFVLSTSKTLYIGLKKKGTFQHSSFLAGGATLSAGRLVVQDGILKAVWPHSGHYLPTEENFLEFVFFLRENNVDLTNVENSPNEEEEVLTKNDKCICHQNNPLQEDFNDESGEASTGDNMDEDTPSSGPSSNSVETTEPPMSRLSNESCSKIKNLEIPERKNVFDIFKKETLPLSCRARHPDSPSEGYETAEESFLSEEEFMVPKSNLFDEDEEDSDEQPILKENILRRIVSHKEMKSYQLAQQLSSKWTTGAGPRIGCMRDYPQELQFKELERAHLSPRAKVVRSKVLTTSLFKDTSTSRSLPQTATTPLAECN